MNTFDEKLKAFAALLEQEQLAEMDRHYTHHRQEGFAKSTWQVTVKPKSKYTCVDVGSSGKYMVVNDTGEIFGIKGYGTIHRGHQYGTLDTIQDWYWGGYHAQMI